MISVHFQGKPLSIIVIQVYTPNSNAKEAEVEWFYEELQDLLELNKNNKKKDVVFIIGYQNVKVGSQEIPRVTGKFSLGVQNRSKANRVLPKEYTDHGKHPLPTTQETTLHMDINGWSISK